MPQNIEGRKGEILSSIVFAFAAVAIVSVWLLVYPPASPEPAPEPVEEPQNIGATIPKVIALFETSLASKVTRTDTSMTLVSGTDKAGTAISGTIGFIIDEGTATEEFVMCTASSTALSGCSRGLNPVTGNTTSSALAFEHRRGASVKITNFPSQGVLSRILNGDETLPNVLRYDAAVTTTTINASGSQAIASKGYVDAVAFAGTPDATESGKGIFEAATCAELGTGTATGSTAALLAAQGKCFNSTSTATTTVPVTKTNGKLEAGFIDGAGTYAWTGPHTFGATTTLASTTAFTGPVSFSQLPTAPTTTPTSTSQLVTLNYIQSLTLPSNHTTSTFTFVAGSGTRDATSTAITINLSSQRTVLLGYNATADITTGAANESGSFAFNINASTSIVTAGGTFETDSSNIAFNYSMSGVTFTTLSAGTSTIAIRAVESGAGEWSATGSFFVIAL
ncbi:MAG: hypothetical protein Q8L86_12540 [Vicinamibacterales bacterium]|nr:hypothetical protein [Vicinamibacterales bacterium]